MGWNVPDDWNAWYRNCTRCGSRYHESEGGCGCLEDHVQCHGDRLGDCWIHMDKVIVLAGHDFCEDHAACDACDTSIADGAELLEVEGDLFCRQCDEQWRAEEAQETGAV